MRQVRERGVILVAVLLAVAIMSVLVVAATALTRAGIGSEQLEQRRLATHLALRSAIEAAKAQILALPPEKRLRLDGSDVALDLGNGLTATAGLRDAAGLIDINRSDPTLIENAVRFAGIDGKKAKDLGQRIAELRKKAEPAGLAATPAKQPATAKPAQQANAGADNAASTATPGLDANAPPPPMVFLSLDQLAGYMDFDPGEARMLGTALTLFNPTGAINPLAAPQQVLAALPGMTARDLSDVSLAKRSPARAGNPGLQQLVTRFKTLVALDEPSVFVIEVTLDAAPGVLGGSKAAAVVRLAPSGPLPFGTLALQEM